MHTKRTALPRLTPSSFITGVYCAHYEWPDPDRCLAPTVDGRDCCPIHTRAVA